MCRMTWLATSQDISIDLVRMRGWFVGQLSHILSARQRMISTRNTQTFWWAICDEPELCWRSRSRHETSQSCKIWFTFHTPQTYITLSIFQNHLKFLHRNHVLPSRRWCTSASAAQRHHLASQNSWPWRSGFCDERNDSGVIFLHR